MTDESFQGGALMNGPDDERAVPRPSGVGAAVQLLFSLLFWGDGSRV